MLELFTQLYPSVVWMIHTEVHIEMIGGINEKSRTESEFGAIIAIVVVAMVLKPRKCLFNTLTLLQNYWYTDMEYHQRILLLTRKITNNGYTDNANHQTILSLTRKITKQYCH